MPKKSFSETWWGNEWLAALERIDRDTNRLPRGRTYARKGAVREIEIKKDGAIAARVQGTRPSPYKEQIQLQLWEKTEQDKVLDYFSSRVDIHAQLLIGQLPSSIEQDLSSMGIRLFPSQWKEIKSKCSCPDWANPCKHLAAVFYIIATEIDKDPFLLFQMRGLSKQVILDLIKVADKTSESYEQFLPQRPKAFLDTIPEPGIPEPVHCEPLEIHRMLRLLSQSPSPIFESTEAFADRMGKAYRAARDRLESEIYADENAHHRVLNDYAYTIIYHEGKVWFQLVSDRDPDNRQDLDPAALFKWFEGASLQIDMTDSRPIRFLKALIAFAYRLIDLNGWLPKVIPLKEGDFFVQFHPFFNEKGLLSYQAYLDELCPFGMVRDDSGEILHSPKIASWLMPIILTAWIREKLKDDPAFFTDELSRVFFSGEVYKANRFERKQTCFALQNWLAPLYLGSSDHLLLLSILPKARQSLELQIGVKKRDDLFFQPMPFSEWWKKEEFHEQRDRLLKQVAFLCQSVPFLSDAFQRSTITLSTEQVVHLLSQAAFFLQFFGVEVVIPKNLKDLSRPKVSALAKAKAKNIKNYMDLASLMEFEWIIDLGDEQMTMEQFREMVSQSKNLIAFKDHYYIIDPQEAQRILNEYQSYPKIGDTEAVHAVLSGSLRGIPFLMDKDLDALLRKLRNVKKVALPKGLNATLRPYQVHGFQWLFTNLTSGFNTCLADDMGLGKTLQVITTILKMKEKKMKEKKMTDSPVLVICPTSVMRNWLHEIQRFAPSLKTGLYHGAARQSLDHEDIWITSYGTVRSDKAILQTRTWSMIVVDEAQNIKNPDSAQTRSVYELKSQYRIAVSGTPVENRLLELWSIFHFLNPGYLGKKTTFLKSVATQIEKFNDIQMMQSLQRCVQPFILRRMKSDPKVISDLPEKIELEGFAALKPAQGALYVQILKEAEKGVYELTGMERKGRIFWMINALKHICNHPVSYTRTGQPRVEDSGKTEMAFEILEKIFQKREKAILFTQYREMGGMLCEMVERSFQIRPLFLNGSIHPNKREELVDRFQNDPASPLIIVTLKAGGTGLNLTAASHVIHYDMWWNPAVMDQATDRAYRIGQKKNVFVHHLRTVGTFEEKIYDMLEAKKKLSEDILGMGERWITELSNDELKAIFQLSESG